VFSTLFCKANYIIHNFLKVSPTGGDLEGASTHPNCQAIKCYIPATCFQNQLTFWQLPNNHNNFFVGIYVGFKCFFKKAITKFVFFTFPCGYNVIAFLTQTQSGSNVSRMLGKLADVP
jgi:hypothetical protein